MSKVKAVSTLDQLKSDLAKKLADRKVEMQTKIEQIKLSNEISKLDSPLYEQRQLEEQDSTQLTVYLNQLEEYYSIDNRKLSRVFGYGVMVDKMLTVIRSIQYCKLDEKVEMLMLTGLTEQLVEDIVDALGNSAYFSVRQLAIVDEQPYDVVKLRELLKIAAVDMGLVSQLNLNKVNEDTFKYQYAKARLRAEEMLHNTMKYSTASVDYTE